MKIAIVGVTGMVGKVMLKLILERKIRYSELILVASNNSIGKQVLVNKKPQFVIGMDEAVKATPNYAIFSAGGETSLKWAPKFANAGSTVIDNSSAWRMDPKKKLIIPEVNGEQLNKNDKIIANPNCSTIQMLMVLAPIHKRYGIKRVVVSTYQSVTGSGVKGLDQLKNEENQLNGEMAYKYPILRNAIPHCDDFLENGYTKEENKLINETRKILNDYSIKITSTAVRVPIELCHGESVNIEFVDEFNLEEVLSVLRSSPGLIVEDEPEKNIYPMPINASNKDEVFVGRIRRDFSSKNSLNLWVVADNLRKGAATNAIQILELLLKKGF